MTNDNSMSKSQSQFLPIARQLLFEFVALEFDLIFEL